VKPLFVLLFALSASVVSAQQVYLRSEVKRVATELGIPPNIAEALVERESEFNPTAINPNDPSYGIMQLYKENLDWFADHFNEGKKFNPFDPTISIRIGLEYLASLYKMFGNWFDTLAAYNAGPAAVSKKKYPASTVRYVNWILNRSLEEK